MTTTAHHTIQIDGRDVRVNGERNLLEVVRKAGIELPTFCYHSELSVYGACRLCLVEIEGRGISGACSTPAEPGLKVKTQTPELREIRQIAIELLLANHDQQCPTCPKSGSCQLQEVARKVGVRTVRFKPVHEPGPLDETSVSLTRDPNKCVLCGDCVRICEEIQSVGAIDFAHRGQQAAVLPAFGAGLGRGECVNCGQCAAVCPTGALTPRPEIEEVWSALHDPNKVVVAQVAPAVRVAIGEAFGLAPGAGAGGALVAALKRLGFDRVYDTAFSADLTVIEEATEFLVRKGNGENLPQLTSCCPGWVKFAEQFFPELLSNLSTCKSPQQMLGAVCKEILPDELGKSPRDIIVVSIMPCTAKKFEARRPEFAPNGVPDVDYVLTTQEVARMIEGAGMQLASLEGESFDMPLGFKTGAGLIFGNSGGVSEAVLRYAAAKLNGGHTPALPDFQAVRGESGLRIAAIKLGDIDLKIGVVHGLANARRIAEQVRKGECDLDLIEVMACPGGCVGGAGQPVSRGTTARTARTRGLYEADKQTELHNSADNRFVAELYQTYLGEVGGKKAHHLLHTHYQNRRRIADARIVLGEGDAPERINAGICVGTNCFLKGSQAVLHDVLEQVESAGLEDRVDVTASFCFERCEHGPTAEVDGEILTGCSGTSICAALREKLTNGNQTSPAQEADEANLNNL